MIFMSKKIFTVLIVFFLLIFSTSAYAAYRNLPFLPEVFQEHDHWCWAATSNAVLRFYYETPSQCTIANWAWSRNDCCGNSTFDWSHDCNVSNCLYDEVGCVSSIESVLSNWNVTSSGSASALSYTTVQSEINNRRPIVARWGWYDCLPDPPFWCGHFLVVFGYNTIGNGWVHYMDPWTGEGKKWEFYSWFNDDGSVHRWTHSLTTADD